MKSITKNVKVITICVLTSLMVSASYVQSVNSYLPDSQPTTTSELLIYMYIDGGDLGNIEGSVTDAGFEGLIEVLGYHHQIQSDLTSRNLHSYVRVVKPLDKASPLLQRAIDYRTILPEVVIEFYRMNAVAQMEAYYQIKLDNAVLREVENQAQANGVFTELLAFQYYQITWTWLLDNIEHSDTWDVDPVS